MHFILPSILTNTSEAAGIYVIAAGTWTVVRSNRVQAKSTWECATLVCIGDTLVHIWVEEGTARWGGVNIWAIKSVCVGMSHLGTVWYFGGSTPCCMHTGRSRECWCRLGNIGQCPLNTHQCLRTKGKKYYLRFNLSKGLHRSHCECSFISCYERKRLAGSHSPAAV